MGWFSNKKEEEELDDIPRLPEPLVDLNFKFPRREDIPDTLPEIPEENLPKLPQTDTSMEKSRFKPLNYPLENLPEPAMEIKARTGKSYHEKSAEPIFVRLDKFQSTLNSFNEIKSKISEIEYLLSKTKELKEKEQKELEEWEHEVHALKARMDSIDRNIFNKLD